MIIHLQKVEKCRSIVIWVTAKVFRYQVFALFSVKYQKYCYCCEMLSSVKKHHFLKCATLKNFQKHGDKEEKHPGSKLYLSIQNCIQLQILLFLQLWKFWQFWAVWAILAILTFLTTRLKVAYGNRLTLRALVSPVVWTRFWNFSIFNFSDFFFDFRFSDFLKL